jgi:hypothetical protein
MVSHYLRIKLLEDANNRLAAILKYAVILALQQIWTGRFVNSGEKYSCTPCTLQYICRGFSIIKCRNKYKKSEIAGNI